MKEITFRFIRGASLASELIEWKGDSEISHVEAVAPDGYLGALLNGGVQLRAFNYCKPSLQILVTIPATDDQEAKFWQSLRSRIGEQYDRAGIAGIALGDNCAGPGTAFCSELQAQAIKDAGIIWIAKDASKIDPETLRLLMTATPGAKEERITA